MRTKRLSTRLALIVGLAGLVFAALPAAGAAAHSYFPGAPWCGPATANAPYQAGSTVVGESDVFCQQVGYPGPYMSVDHCLQWYNWATGYYIDATCTNNSGYMTSSVRYMLHGCATGWWRTRIYAQWYLDGHWHATSDVGPSVYMC